MYGDYKLINRSLSQFQDMSSDVYWDVDLAWDVSDTLSVTFGGTMSSTQLPILRQNSLVVVALLHTPAR